MVRPMLTIAGLSRHFDGVEALVDIDLEVPEGGIYGLIGPNGSGKTTLFNVVTGIYPPSRGRITFDGAEIGGRPGHEIVRRGIARTFQTPRMYGRMTVFENVRAASPRTSPAADRRRIVELLAATGLADRADELAKKLTLPEQRRLEVARALARDPKLLLLDEPAGGMTPSETNAMGELIETVAAPGRTCVVIEHKMDMIASLCARVCVLDFGRKIAEGTPDAVLADPIVLEAYIGQDQAPA